MFSLKISRLFEQLPAPQPSVAQAPARPRLVADHGRVLETPPLPDGERRLGAARRQAERREKQEAALLDTRKLQGRRRSPGRRAEDRQARSAHYPISVKA
ncbi:MAG: hypothetical protein V4582_02180 [Pseudomonadota bacterium]